MGTDDVPVAITTRAADMQSNRLMPHHVNHSSALAAFSTARAPSCSAHSRRWWPVSAYSLQAWQSGSASHRMLCLRTGIMALWVLRRWMTAAVRPCFCGSSSVRLQKHPASEKYAEDAGDVIMDETVTVLGISQRWRVLLARSYLLLRASQESHYASVSADARSPNFRDTAPLCVMKFWYNYFTMNHTYSFKANMRVDNFFVSLWELSLLGERRPEGTWNQGQILIGRYRTDLMIIFRVEESPTLRGYTAMDDVTFEDCAMPTPSVKLEPGKFLCRNNVSIDTDYRCDYVDHCGDYSDEENCDDFKFRCNFDSSFCDWMPVAPAGNVGHGWERASPSWNLKEGPTRDHTTGNKEGHFLYLGSNTRTTSASILGPKLLNSSECRMRFHYIIRGPAAAVLTVNTRSTSDGAFKEIWRSDRPSEFFHFTEASVTFQEDQPFQVSFGGTVEGARDLPGYVAIDDVSFTPTCSPFHGHLPPAPKVTTVAPKACPKDNFACASLGGCIPLDQVCDFKNQCSDGSDEAQCGKLLVVFGIFSR
ncbi:MAM and LDL-receptor class A domain-containing protein 2 isoform X2 [Ixodes scapularis]